MDELLTDEEIDHETKIILQNRYCISWSEMCKWFKDYIQLEGEQAVLAMMTAIAQAQLSKCLAHEAEAVRQARADTLKEVGEWLERRNNYYLWQTDVDALKAGKSPEGM